MNKDSFFGTVVVAVVLCLACSIVVAGSSTALKSMQDRNAELKRKRNVLEAAGLYDANENKLTNDQIEETFKRVKTIAVTLKDGTLDDTIDVNTYSSEKAAKSPKSRHLIDGDYTLKGFTYREDVALAYLLNGDDGKLEKVILPVYGKGLWSTLKGFIALENDFQTVSGLTFYSHAETPGLGGEVDNPKWKAQWRGEKALTPDLKPQMRVVKGGAPAGDDSAVDGLSGATITSVGVENLVNYWLSDGGFGPFLAKLKNNEITVAASGETQQTLAAQ